MVYPMGVGTKWGWTGVGLVSEQQRTANPRSGSSSVLNGSAQAAAEVASAGCVPDSRPMMDPERRADVLLRLAKAAGQVQGVARMINDDRYCVDVLTQIAAAQKALDGAARVITRNYLERCVTDAITSGDPLIYDEVMKVIDRHR